MQEIELPSGSGITQQEIAKHFEALCEKSGLETKRLTLKKFPGGIHWHITTPGNKGTLEATLHQGRLWLSVHDNRQADWQKQAISLLQAELAACLGVD